MAVKQLLQQMHQRYDGFNPPAEREALARLQKIVGPLPADIVELYQDHDGSPELPSRGEHSLPARLLPIEEAIETQSSLEEFTTTLKAAGDIAWLWYDEQSNYVGVFTGGMLSGWLVKLNHDEPVLAPAYRSVESFLTHLLASAPGTADEEHEAIDLVGVPRDLPAVADDPQHVATDRKLAGAFREMYEREEDEDQRRVWAISAIAVTPASDTATLIPFLQVDDTWIPEVAVHMMEIRGFRGAVPELERLARDGKLNGDAAAMRQLVRNDTPEALAAVTRLQSELKDQKLRSLEVWVKNRGKLQRPRWE